MKRRGPTLSSISETCAEGTCDTLLEASPAATACTATSSPANSSADWDAHSFHEEPNRLANYYPPPLFLGRSRDSPPSTKYRSLLLRKRLLVILCSLSVTTWTLCSQRLWAVQDGRVNYWRNSNNNIGEYDRSLPRQLFQDLPTVAHGFRYTTSTLRITASSLVVNNNLNILEHAGYTAKPIMVGMIWPGSPKKQTTGVDTNNDTEERVEESIVVSINPHTFQVTPAKTRFRSTTQSTATTSSTTTRRSLLPPNYAKLFPAMTGGDPRSVTFDINYTMTYDPTRFEEKDEGFPWPIPDGCEMQYDWQSESHPTCNTMHEQDVPAELTTTFTSSSNSESNNNNKHDSMRAQLLAAGGYRNVWMIHNGTQVAASTKATGSHADDDDSVVTRDPPIALKTLLYERDWYQMQYKRHNLDALVASRLQSSPTILNIHGYCGTSGLYQFARGGNLQSVTEKSFNTYTPRIKLELSYNVAHAIADLHNMAKEGVPVVSHTDIFPNQFVRLQETDPSFLLNDFNRARWVNLPVSNSNMTKETCGFTFPRNRGKFRSPEEYRYQLETEAVDVYSAGNIFFYLLVGEFPFATRSRDTVKRSLKAGKRQRIPEEYATSDDPLIQALVKAIRMCWIQIPADRATARQVQKYLGRAMKALN